jgi:hypothetical protein
MTVYRSDPTQRGFGLPCPLWKGKCTIHETPHYPRTCRAYRCRLLKELDGDRIALAEALPVIERVKKMIAELEPMLPASESQNFRERLVGQIEHPEETAWDEESYLVFREKAGALLRFYADHFGVTDLLE